MTNQSLLERYPVERLVPVDGMAVTAQVWGEAHEYHRQVQSVLSRYSVGHGVLAGMDVMPSDPPDKSVFVSPGIALDHDGNIVVVSKPVAFEIGNTPDGTIHLVISYGEGRARLKEGANSDDPHYSRSEFVIEALPNLPDYAHVELGRILRQGRSSSIVAAADPKHPQSNELDLRFRSVLTNADCKTISIGVVDLGVSDVSRITTGLDNLAAYVNRNNSELQVCVTPNVALDQHLDTHDLLYICGEKKFELSNPQSTVLHEYLKGSGCVVYEGHRQGSKVSDPPADKSFKDLAQSLGISLVGINGQDPLMQVPHFFAQLPHGFETQGDPNVEVSEDGVIFSAEDYCSLWAGKRRNSSATREEIRTAFEWGENILTWVGAQQK